MSIKIPGFKFLPLLFILLICGIAGFTQTFHANSEHGHSEVCQLTECSHIELADFNTGNDLPELPNFPAEESNKEEVDTNSNQSLGAYAITAFSLIANTFHYNFYTPVICSLPYKQVPLYRLFNCWKHFV